MPINFADLRDAEGKPLAYVAHPEEGWGSDLIREVDSLGGKWTSDMDEYIRWEQAAIEREAARR